MLDQEENYIKEELERIGIQNNLMEKDQKELQYHKQQLDNQKQMIDKELKLSQQELDFHKPKELQQQREEPGPLERSLSPNYRQ